ncbi:MAG: ABC transporter ATP-binding protein [Rhodospirillales bacterium]|nr:ABC transporter ATP-binding protein [Rhodospirillales bacterium]
MNRPASDPAFRLDGVVRTYRQGQTRLEVLKGVDLTLNAGEVVALVGPSGAGKSTLLHVGGLLEPPDGGEVYISGQACNGLGDDARTRLRRHNIGFVYQYHHLLPEFSALENIAIPQIIAGEGRGKALARARALLGELGLAARASHRPARLSGGEQQRVAIARAIANEPRLLLADEPTGNLDPHTADGVFTVLLTLAREVGLAALVATHNPTLAARMDRTLRLDDGHLVAA